MVINMMYKVGMLCKHFKGNDLLEKNIYRIEKIGVKGTDIDDSITYTGDGDLSCATNLVVYSNIFQNNKMFCREYEDISSTLSDEKKELFHQDHRVEPLTAMEIMIIESDDFSKLKKLNEIEKRKK